MKTFGDNHWDKKEIKDAEIIIAEYFEWELDQLTFFDYLQQLIVGGVLLSTDKLQKGGKKSSLGSSQTTENSTLCNTPDRKDSGNSIDALGDIQKRNSVLGSGEGH